MGIYLVLSFSLGITIGIITCYFLKKKIKDKTFHKKILSLFEIIRLLVLKEKKTALLSLEDMIKKEREHPLAYIILGTLYRETEELTRALRLHQSLLGEIRHHPKLYPLLIKEIAEDFKVMKFPQRAIKFLEEQLKNTSEKTEIAKSLMNLYEEVNDWEGALLASERLKLRHKSEYKSRIAHIYAASAETLLEKKELSQSKQRIKKALALDPQNPQALFVYGRLLIQQQDYKRGAEILKKALYLYPYLCSRFFPDFVEACFKMKQMEKIKEFLENKGPPDIDLKYMSIHYLAKQDKKRAHLMLKELLEEHPDFLPAQLEMHLLHLDNKQSELKSCLAKLILWLQRYKCKICGYEQTHHSWYCKRCKEWGSFRGSFR
jgi:lipopolysaccharide biosynthesis regulator YciM